MREYFIWLAKFITVVVIFFVALPIFMVGLLAASQEMLESGVGKPDAKKAVAVIELTGVIDSSKEILEQLYKQAENDKVKGIVLRIDSPGGAVGPSQEIYSAVRKLKEKKPIVASMGSVAASGGLYSALGASKVLCQPGTLTGSIGVIMQIPNFAGITQKVGVDMITIKSGKLKDVGNTFREMTEEERAFVQGEIIKVHKDFVNAVVEGRAISEEEALKFTDGRIIIGSDAVKLKLVDGYGDLYDAAKAVFEILGEPLAEDEMPKLIYTRDKFTRIREILDSFSKLGGVLDSRARLMYLLPW